MICQQLRMGIRLFPCCLTALLTCKNSAPLCPMGDGKIPRFDPFKGDFGVCIKSLISALKSQNDSNLQRFLSKHDGLRFRTLSPPFLCPKMANEAARLHFTAATAVLHSKATRFFFTSSLGPEALLVKALPAIACEDVRFAHL